MRLSLEKKLGAGQVHDAGSGPMVVILLGMDHLLEAEGDLRLSDEERSELRRDHTRKLYMGFTRAGQRLVVLKTNF